MKAKLIPLIVVLAVATATILFSHDIDHYDDDQDKLQRGLAGINNILKNNANVTFRYYDVDRNLHSRIRYIIAPSYLALDAHVYDTTLTVCSLGISDSISKVATGNKKLLWQNKDNRYAYFLTSGK